MQIYELSDRPPQLLDRLVRVWEASVRATHRIKAYVPQALGGVAHLVVAEDRGEPVAFLGTEAGRLEMLFL